MGSVSWQFSEKGVIIIDGKLLVQIKKWNEVKEIVPYEKTALEEDLLGLDIDDFEEQENICRVVTSRENFIHVRKKVEELWYNISDADIQFLPQNTISLNDQNFATFERILEGLEADEDVNAVYHNVA